MPVSRQAQRRTVMITCPNKKCRTQMRVFKSEIPAAGVECSSCHARIKNIR